MPVAKPGPRPQFTEEFLVKLRPDKREALDHGAEVTGMTRSEALRRFIDQGFTVFRSALETLYEAEPVAVAAAVAHDPKETYGHA